MQTALAFELGNDERPAVHPRAAARAAAQHAQHVMSEVGLFSPPTQLVELGSLFEETRGAKIEGRLSVVASWDIPFRVIARVRAWGRAAPTLSRSTAASTRSDGKAPRRV